MSLGDRLLEREHVLEQLEGHLEAALAGTGRLTLVHGEAGAGKTAAVNHFANGTCSARRILVGACDPLSTPRPLGPLVDIAADLGPGVEESLKQAVEGTHSVSSVFERLLAELRREPAVVVFEDVHWADEATLDLLRFLARRVERTSALLVATYRDDALGPNHPLAVMLGDLATCPSVHRCRVEPLSRLAVAQIARGRSDNPEELHRVTDGNPFFVTEVLATGGGGIPATIRAAVTGRLARLSIRARALAESLAVLGVPAAPELVGMVAPDADAALDEALASSFLVLDGLRVAFRHELARRAVYDSVPAHRRVRLHRQVLSALTAQDAAPDMLARLAYHAEEAHDTDAVCRYAPAAAMHALALRAYREAAAQCERALRHGDALPPAQRLALLVGRSFACYCTGPMTEAVAARSAALELRRALGDRLGEAEDLTWLSHMMRVAGQSRAGLALGRDALSALDGPEPTLQRANAHLNLAELAVLRHDLAETEAQVGAALALADLLQAPAIATQARFHRLTARLVATGEGWEDLDEIRLCAAQSSPEQNVGQIAAIQAYIATVRRDFARAVPATEWAVEYCIDHDLTLLLQAVHGFAAYGLLHRGQWTEAREMAVGVLRHPGLPPALQVLPTVVLGLVRARLGEPDSWPVLDEALTLVEPGELLLNHVWQARAEAAWLAGDDLRVVVEAQQGLDQVLALNSPDPWMTGVLARWVLLATGAAPAVPAAEPAASELVKDWAAAAAAWERLGCPYDAALARLGGDASALRQALDTFEGLGARPAVTLTRQRMRELGLSRQTRGPHAVTQANPHRLTRREMQVSQLLRDGLSDAEIATRLVISTRTASSHVSAILAKLHVRTRHQAARKLG